MPNRSNARPLLATASMEVDVAALERDQREHAGDLLMEQLREANVLDPVVSNDVRSAVIHVSFDLAATGVVDADRASASEVVRRAVHSAASELSTSTTWGGTAQLERLEYQLAATGDAS